MVTVTPRTVKTGYENKLWGKMNAMSGICNHISDIEQSVETFRIFGIKVNVAEIHGPVTTVQLFIYYLALQDYN